MDKDLLYQPYKGDDDPLEEDDTEFVLEEMKRYQDKSAWDEIIKQSKIYLKRAFFCLTQTLAKLEK